MGYSGNAYPIDFSKGGLTGNKNQDSIAPYMMVWPSRNINMHNNVREKRGGTSMVYDTPVAGGSAIRGVYDFSMLDGSQFIIRSMAGLLYKDETNTIKTGMSATNNFSFATGENKLFIADSATQLQIWTGTGSTRAVTTPAADWSTTPPFQVVLHKRANSQRICAITSTNLYMSKSYSAAGDLEDFGNTNGLNFPMQTGDGWGLVAEIEHNNELWLFGKRTSYRLVDTDTTPANWGISPNLFIGGVGNWRLLCRTPNNDLVAMMEDGEIYSINAVQQYGDYKRASLTAPAKMDIWIREHVDLTQIDKYHMVYDPYIRAIRTFVVSAGASQVDTCLVYFIDRTPEEAWMVHDNPSQDSGFNASASTLVRKSAGVYKVYTGDYNGDLWELETSSYNDNGEAYTAGFKTPAYGPENLRMNKMFKNIRPIMKPKGDYSLQAQYWVDGRQVGSDSIDMSGGDTVVGDAYVGTATVAQSQILDEPIYIGEKGVRIQFQLWNEGADQAFEISGAILDAKVLGAKT